MIQLQNVVKIIVVKHYAFVGVQTIQICLNVWAVY